MWLRTLYFSCVVIYACVQFCVDRQLANSNPARIANRIAENMIGLVGSAETGAHFGQIAGRGSECRALRPEGRIGYNVVQTDEEVIRQIPSRANPRSRRVGLLGSDTPRGLRQSSQPL